MEAHHSKRRRSPGPLALGLALSLTVGVMLSAPGFAGAQEAAMADLAAEATHKFRPAGEQGIHHEYLVALEREGVEKRRRGVSRQVLADTADQLRHEYGFEMIERWRRIVPMLLVRMDPLTARALAADPRVALVEQNRRLELDRPLPGEGSEAELFTKQVCATPASPQAITGCPNPGPTGCTDNWGLDRIDALPGQPFDGQYSWGTSGFGVHVFVFDVGMQAQHCELVGRVPDDPNATDPAGNSHATRVASIIGGSSIGVAKDVIFHNLALGNLNNIEALRTGQMLDGFEEIAATIEERNIGPAVVNTSWNIPKLSSDPLAAPNVIPGAVSLMARTLVEDYGVTLVVAAGNRGTSPLDFSPSDLGYVEGVIVVGGTDANDQRWARDPGDPLCAPGGTLEGECGSNFGPGIDLWAPAEWIYGATRDNGNNASASTLSGTSFAAPHVTGAVARFLQFDPNATPKSIETSLKAQALAGELDDIGDAPNLLLNVRNLPSIASAAPTARADHVTTRVDLSVDVAVLYNDLDRDGNFLSITNVSNPPNGSATVLGEQIRYTPDDNFMGTDSFTYTVSDGSLSATALVTVVVDPDLPPVAVPDYKVFPLPGGQQPGEAFTFFEADLLGNDVDPGGTTTRYVSHGLIDGGQITRVEVTGISIFQYEFVPDVSTFGADHTYSFDLTVRDLFNGNDGVDHTDTAAVRLRTYTQGAGAPPTAIRDEAYTEPGQSVVVDVLANDTDDAGPLTLLDVEPPRQGSVTFQANGDVTYQPPPGFEGWDGFTYVIQDGAGNLGAESVIVQIGGNRPPSTPDRGFETAIGQSLVIPFADLVGSGAEAAGDPDGDPLAVSSWGQPNVGNLTGGGISVTFTPPAGFEGNSVFTYTVTDGRGGFGSARATVQVGEPTGDFDDGDDGHPDGTPNFVTIPAGSTSYLIHHAVLLGDDSDPDQDSLRVCGYLDTTVHGTLDTTPVIGVEYEPGASFWTAGSDTFYYKLSDRSDCSRIFPIRVTVVAGSTAPSCQPPATGNWVVSTSCTFQGAANAPANVIVQNGATLTISSGSTLDIAFNQHYLLVRDGCRVLVKAGGKID